MSLIKISNLNFSYDTSIEPVFENLSLTLDTNWKTGLAGRNGSGKTTLLHLLESNEKYPAQIMSDVSFQYFPASLNKKEKDKTPIEIFELLCPGEEVWKLQYEMALAQIDLGLYERPFSTFSLGEQAQFQLACLFVNDHSFLLIDEPTCHMDLETRNKVKDYLKKKKSFILVSHDRALLNEVCDHTVYLEHHQAIVRKGSYSSFLEEKQIRKEGIKQENLKLKRQINSFEKTFRKSKDWADKSEKKIKKSAPNEKIDRGFVSHKAAKKMKRAKAIEKRKLAQMESKKQLVQFLEKEEALIMKPKPPRNGSLVSLYQIQLYRNKQPVLEKPVSFSIRSKERILLQGRNGCGKSSLIHFLSEGMLDHTGEIYTASHLKISLVKQDCSSLSGSFASYIEDEQIPLNDYLTVLYRLGFSREELASDLSELSSGQKQKAALAKSICASADLYIWDEPFNYLDLEARKLIENMIIEDKPTLIVIEHDELFSKKIPTQIIHLVDEKG